MKSSHSPASLQNTSLTMHLSSSTRNTSANTFQHVAGRISGKGTVEFFGETISSTSSQVGKGSLHSMWNSLYQLRRSTLNDACAQFMPDWENFSAECNRSPSFHSPARRKSWHLLLPFVHIHAISRNSCHSVTLLMLLFPNVFLMNSECSARN